VLILKYIKPGELAEVVPIFSGNAAKIVIQAKIALTSVFF